MSKSKVFIKRPIWQPSWTAGEALVQSSRSQRAPARSQHGGPILRVHSSRAAWRPRTSRRASVAASFTQQRSNRFTMIGMITLQNWQTGAPSLNTWPMEIADRCVHLQRQQEHITGSYTPPAGKSKNTTWNPGPKLRVRKRIWRISYEGLLWKFSQRSK